MNFFERVRGLSKLGPLLPGLSFHPKNDYGYGETIEQEQILSWRQNQISSSYLSFVTFVCFEVVNDLRDMIT